MDTGTFLPTKTGSYGINLQYGNAHAAGGTVLLWQAELGVDGLTRQPNGSYPPLYLQVGGARRKVSLITDFPGADRKSLTLHLNHYVQVWSAAEGGQLLYDPNSSATTLTYQDGYGLNNWADKPNEVYLQAFAPFRNVTISADFWARSSALNAKDPTNPYPWHPEATNPDSITLNCVALDLQFANTPDDKEENPGAYINVNWDDDDNDGWTNNGQPPAATYTPDKDDNEVVGGDDDLRQCVLSQSGMLGGESVTLTFPGNIRCWGTNTKVQNGASSEITSGTQIPAMDLPKTFYVEGVSGSMSSMDTPLVATYSEDVSVTDKVNITVFEITLRAFYSGQQQWDDDISFPSLGIGSGSMLGLISWDDADGDGVTGDMDDHCMYFHNIMELQGTVWPVIGAYEVGFSFKQDIKRNLFEASLNNWDSFIRDSSWRPDNPYPWQMDTIPSEYGQVYKISVQSSPTEDDYVYEVDGPGWGRVMLLGDDHYVGQVCDFRDCAVVIIGGTEYQCSDWFNWHSKLYLMPKDDGLHLTRDARALQLLGGGWIVIPQNPERELP